MLPMGFETILVNLPMSGAITRYYQEGGEITKLVYEELLAQGASGLEEVEGALSTLFNAGISAFPMSARVVQKMDLKEDPQNFLLW